MAAVRDGFGSTGEARRGGQAPPRAPTKGTEGRHFPVALCVALWLLLGWLTGASAQSSSLRITFLDVGQGDAVLIESPSGQTVLYDGGERSDTALGHLNGLGIERLDLVVASHNHADHIGGLAAVLRQFRPRFYLDNGLPATTQTYRRVLEAVESAGSQVLEPTARQIALGDAILHVLPPSGQPAWDQNDNSVGLVLEYGEFRLLLAGDAEHRQWDWWLRHAEEHLQPVHVHKASHHGSRNGDTADALARLRPEVVVIGVGAGNRYDHPHAEALALYRGQGATVYRTDLHGTILLEAEPSGRYTVHVERGEGARPPTPTSSSRPDTGSQPAPARPASCIDINSASLADLQQITHIGAARAQQVLELRRARPFRSVRDLTRVNGIGAARLSDIIAQGRACVP